jgi:hypothetical protein
VYSYIRFWEKHYTKWGNTEIWDIFFIEKIPNSSRSESYNALGAELNILIRKLKPNTRASQKALFLQNNLKVSIFHELANMLRLVLLVWGRRAPSLM